MWQSHCRKMCQAKQCCEESREMMRRRCSTTKPIEGSALSLEGVDNIERGDSLAFGVLSVGDGVTDNLVESAITLHE